MGVESERSGVGSRAAWGGGGGGGGSELLGEPYIAIA